MDSEKIGSAEGVVDAPGCEPSPSVLLNIRVPRPLRERFKAVARADGRTMSATLRLLVERYLRDAGHG